MARMTKKTYSSRIGKLQDLIYQGVPDDEMEQQERKTPFEMPNSDSDSDGGTVLFDQRRKLQ